MQEVSYKKLFSNYIPNAVRQDSTSRSIEYWQLAGLVDSATAYSPWAW
jgi:hypothetical protein